MMKRWIWGILLLGSFSSKAEVWETTQTWTLPWELKYQRFIQEIDTEFCTSKKMFSYCSATAYQLRATFASKHGLPFLIHNYATKKIVTNESKGWDKYPVSSRADAFIRDIARARMAYSGHIANDVFAIHPQDLRPGDLLIEKGHVRVIKNIRENGLIDMVATTEDDEPQELWEEVFVYTDPPEEGFGFFRFQTLVKDESGIHQLMDRAPQLKKPDQSKLHPDHDVSKWIQGADAEAILDEELPFFMRLAYAIKGNLSRGPTYLEVGHALLENIDQYVSFRDNLVVRSGTIREKRALTATERENFSTHSRDRRFAKEVELLLRLAKEERSLASFFASLRENGNRYRIYSVEKKQYHMIPKFKILALALAQHSKNQACSGHKEVFTANADDPSYLRWPLKHFGFTGGPYSPGFDRACIESLGIDVNDYFFK